MAAVATQSFPNPISINEFFNNPPPPELQIILALGVNMISNAIGFPEQFAQSLQTEQAVLDAENPLFGALVEQNKIYTKESYAVTTNDGYILLLHRIGLKRNFRKAKYNC